jgi:hypothetical protein
MIDVRMIGILRIPPGSPFAWPCQKPLKLEPRYIKEELDDFFARQENILLINAAGRISQKCSGALVDDPSGLGVLSGNIGIIAHQQSQKLQCNPLKKSWIKLVTRPVDRLYNISDRSKFLSQFTYMSIN